MIIGVISGHCGSLKQEASWSRKPGDTVDPIRTMVVRYKKWKCKMDVCTMTMDSLTKGACIPGRHMRHHLAVKMVKSYCRAYICL